MSPIVHTAMMVPAGSDLYHGAVDICDIRGIDPHEQHVSSMGFVLTNWQKVIAEIMIANQMYMLIP